MPKHYSKDFKESILQKMLSTTFTSISNLAFETGISNTTLTRWRDLSGFDGSKTAKKTNRMSVLKKFQVILEVEALNEAELSQYCREHGFLPKVIKEWKEDAFKGLKSKMELKKEQTKLRQNDAKKIRDLESELRRKDKALAETAALLVLSKEARAFWTEQEDKKAQY